MRLFALRPRSHPLWRGNSRSRLYRQDIQFPQALIHATTPQRHPFTVRRRKSAVGPWGLETTHAWHFNDLRSRARTEKEGLGSPWNPRPRVVVQYFARLASSDSLYPRRGLVSKCIGRPVIVRGFPRLVRVIKLHFFENLERIRAQILLIDNSFVTDDECLDARNAIICWSGGKSEASDHRPLYDKIHRTEWGRETLAFQDFEEISMIWLGLIRVALLQGIGNFLGDWPAQRLIRIPPNQTVVLSGGADDFLCVLIYLGVVMPFQSIFLLGIHIAAADFDGIQFIASDATVQNFLAARRGVKEPYSVSLDDGDRQRPIFVSHHKSDAVRILGIDNNGVFLVSLCSKRNSDVLVPNGVLRSDQVFATRTENLV